MKDYPAHLLTDGRNQAGAKRWQQALFVLIFKHDTPSGKLFDIALILAILASVLVLVLSTVDRYNRGYGQLFYYMEWAFTIGFTLEYALRLACVKNTRTYAKSFYGIVDLFAILPTYLQLMLQGASYLLVVRILRILRIFRVLKLTRYVGEANALVEALSASRRKIVVFVYAVFTLVIIFGSLMYLVEGAEHGFTSIPVSIYWSIVTLTTVGYGDIAPQTPLGQAIASIVMIMGYGIIAVPTGIFAAELGQVMVRRQRPAESCPRCGMVGHEADAHFCRHCGGELKPGAQE